MRKIYTRVVLKLKHRLASCACAQIFSAEPQLGKVDHGTAREVARGIARETADGIVDGFARGFVIQMLGKILAGLLTCLQRWNLRSLSNREFTHLSKMNSYFSAEYHWEVPLRKTCHDTGTFVQLFLSILPRLNSNRVTGL